MRITRIKKKKGQELTVGGKSRETKSWQVNKRGRDDQKQGVDENSFISNRPGSKTVTFPGQHLHVRVRLRRGRSDCRLKEEIQLCPTS